MRICTSCGAQIDDDARFCTSCGAVAPSDEPEQPTEHLLHEDNGGDSAVHPETKSIFPEPEKEHEAPFVPQPSFDERSQSVRPAFEEPLSRKPDPQVRTVPFGLISTASYFWTMFLFCIPGLGHLVAAVWALGGAKNPNRKNLAKAYLLLTLIGLVILSAVYLLLKLFPEELLGWLPDNLYSDIRWLLNV